MSDAQSKNPSAGKPKRKKKKRKVHPVVENVESLVMAVVLALIIRTFIIEAFVIPTGSMAETLYGEHLSVTCPNCGHTYPVGLNGASEGFSRMFCPNCGVLPAEVPRKVYGGDRILVNKALYRLYPPTRWDPFVFINPAIDRSVNPPKTTYIKRLVGMPDERLEIIHGDVVVNGKICRKPPSVQKSLWMPVYDSRRFWKTGSPWRLGRGEGWSFDGRTLSVDCPGAVEAVWAQYAGRGNRGLLILDDYGYDVGQGLGFNVVTDVRVRFNVTVERTGKLLLKLPIDEKSDVAWIDFDANTVTLTPEGKRPTSGKFTPAADGPTAVSFYRVDYRLALAIDGKDVVEYDLWDDAEYQALLRKVEKESYLSGHDNSGCLLGAMKGRFTLTDLCIDRDIYYTPYFQRSAQGSHHYARWDIPEDSYFALGDNSPDSRDSRDWKYVPGKNLIGKALIIWWPVTRIGLIR